MVAKRSPTLPPPLTDGAARREAAAIELRVRIPGELFGRLQQLATDDNRSLKQEAEWLLWGAIQSEPLVSELERPVSYRVVSPPGHSPGQAPASPTGIDEETS